MIARYAILGGVAALLFAPGSASAQVFAGLGINSTLGSQLAAPPAGVGLHQQYMQLYGLPTTFTQAGQVNNGGQAGIFPGGGYGGVPRYFGVNYARRLAAAQAQAYYNNLYNNTGYGKVGGGYYQPPTPNYNSPSQSSQPTSYQSFGMASANPPTFNQLAQLSNRPSPGFGGFGLTSTANPFLPNQNKDEKKEEKKDDMKE